MAQKGWFMEEKTKTIRMDTQATDSIFWELTLTFLTFKLKIHL